jgi:hypothetical protein
MDTRLLEKKFEGMGARIKFSAPPSRRSSIDSNGVRLNVVEDKVGECFTIAVNGEPEVSVLDLQPKDRHLLLMVRSGKDKSKFLCGHDERHWFVAAIPETAPVGTVRQAKESLKPREVQQRQVGLKAKDRNLRKNAAYIRQGEWFFIPDNIVLGAKDYILKSEPITRGRGSKPHICEFMYRSRGETVYVCPRYPNGVSVNEYNRLLKTVGEAKRWGWRQMMKDASVYVKGTVRHPDHKTIFLDGWHRVVMNTENQAAAMRQVAFLD